MTVTLLGPAAPPSGPGAHPDRLTPRNVLLRSPLPPPGAPGAVAGAAASSPEGAVPREPGRPSTAEVTAAQRWATGRQGQVTFAVMTTDGRMLGRGTAVAQPSASVVKAMLLIAYLRAHRTLDPGARATLAPMIRVSDNASALRIYAVVGKDGLRTVGRAAGMRRLDVSGSLFDTRITAGDQARLFARLDLVVPRHHRRYARDLLAGVVAWQSWGIPRAVRRRDLVVRFKGGWRDGLVHQAAQLVPRRGADSPGGVPYAPSEAFSIAVLTAGNPSTAYGSHTIEGIARRLLRPRSGRGRGAG